ncbi:SHOCT domain-containing protein [Candidatus Pelagibacter sp.]|nr:SHOCT domain-containing protein [Candidatus Pelagibacter sp.]
MLNYLVFGIAIMIFATVIIISGKAISRGIEAKQNKKDKYEDEKIAISDIEENSNTSNTNSNLIDQINDLNKLKEQGIISDDEFKKAKEKILN